jgi:DNA-binding transcriptional regulator YiaG
MKRPVKSKNRQTSDGQRIIKGLTELAESLERGEPLQKRFTVRTVELPSAPRVYAPRAVRATRAKLGASQPVFASLMGISTALVQHWEQGFRKPSRMACRLLDEINRDPERWSKMVATRKSA